MNPLRFLPLLAALASPVSAHSDEVERLMERGRWKEARAALEARARSKPDDPATLVAMSRMKLAFHAPNEALALVERAAALDPRSADARHQLAQVCGYMAQRAGKVKQFGLARRLRKEAEQALALDPSHLEARQTLMSFYSLAPGIVGGDDKKASALAEEIGKLDRARGLLAQAELAARSKNPEGAGPLLERAVEADPASYLARVSLARHYGDDSRKRHDLAEKHARAAIAIDPGRAAAYTILAAVLAGTERWAELDAILEEAERRAPGNLTPHYTAARSLILNGKDLPRAERYLRRYLTQEPEGGAPTLAHAHWRLAGALEKQGRSSAAIAELEAALALNPDLTEAKKELRRLKRG